MKVARGAKRPITSEVDELPEIAEEMIKRSFGLLEELTDTNTAVPSR